MEPINERIDFIIRKSGDSKKKWSEAIGVTPQFISSLCNGKKKPSDRTIRDICKKANIREEWLRNGEEPMYIEDPLEELLNSREISEEDRSAIASLVRAFLGLEKTSRTAVIQFVQNFAKELKQTDTVVTHQMQISETEKENTVQFGSFTSLLDSLKNKKQTGRE